MDIPKDLSPYILETEGKVMCNRCEGENTYGFGQSKKRMTIQREDFFLLNKFWLLYTMENVILKV